MKKGIRRIKLDAGAITRAVSEAIMARDLLRNALRHAKNAGACYTVAYIRAAISSAKGAVRAAEYRQARQRERWRLTTIKMEMASQAHTRPR
jgi:hypothetical protein